MILNKPLS